MANKKRHCYSDLVKNCVVSFLDIDGMRHSVEVQAESLYEAAAKAFKIFKDHDCAPGLASRLEVEVRSSVTHALTVKKLKEWIDGGSKSPNEAVVKQRLRKILAD